MKRHYSVVFSILIIMLTSCSSPNPGKKLASDILYTQLNWDTSTSAWVFNVDDGKKRKIGDGLWAREWSPSGKNILLDGHSRVKRGQVWVSAADGTNLVKVFDTNEHPETATFFPEETIGSSQTSFWLTDSLILIQPLAGPIILYDITQKKIVEVRKDAVLTDVSSGGEYWIETQLSNPNKYLLVSLNTAPLVLSKYGPAYYAYHISPNGAEIAYSVLRDNAHYIAISKIDPQLGMHNEILAKTLSKPIRDFRWSSDQNSLLYFYRDTNSKQLRCIVMSIFDGKETYNQPCESKTDILLWSPRSDGFLTQPDSKKYFFYHLDGSMETMLEVPPETEASYQIADWRLIEVP